VVQLVELALPMSEAMTTIYTAIGELMAGCIKELRASNKACTCRDNVTFWHSRNTDHVDSCRLCEE
jgi:hypothetical protein